MAEKKFDCIIVGSGPGGYIAAVRAHQLGMSTAIIERDRLGGICLNWGCIPTKALLKNAEYMNFLSHAGEFGFGVGEVTVDFPRVIARSREVADTNSSGVGFLMKKNKVEVFNGSGTLVSNGAVEIRNADGEVVDTLSATRGVIVATGARPRVFPGIEVDRDRVITSTEAMLLEKPPGSMVIIGAGAIGIEFAYFFNAFGTKVTVIEMMPQILPVEDDDSSKEVARAFKKRKVDILTETRVLSAAKKGSGVEVVIETKKGEKKTLTADYALNAVGVTGNVENLGLESLGVAVEKGHVVVDKFMRTNVDRVYAIGDVVGPPWLAHVASAEGVVAVEHMAGHDTPGMDYSNVPGCTYCQPQVASVGLTERKARELGHDIKIGRFPFKASGKARAIGETDGFVKLIIDARYGEILGGHIVGAEATEMIAEIVTARAADATAETLFKTIHAHPTLSEGVMEAAADAYGEALNI